MYICTACEKDLEYDDAIIASGFLFCKLCEDLVDRRYCSKVLRHSIPELCGNSESMRLNTRVRKIAKKILMKNKDHIAIKHNCIYML
jgi:hypothetical protein